MQFTLNPPSDSCWVWIIEIYEGVKMNPTIEYFQVFDNPSLWENVLFGEVIPYLNNIDIYM